MSVTDPKRTSRSGENWESIGCGGHIHIPPSWIDARVLSYLCGLVLPRSGLGLIAARGAAVRSRLRCFPALRTNSNANSS